MIENTFNDYNYEDIGTWFEEHSSSRFPFSGLAEKSNGLIGRQLNVNTSLSEFVIHCNKSGAFKSVALSQWEDLISEADNTMLPFIVTDGINEKGLSVSVIAEDNSEELQTINEGGEESCHVDYLARWMLDNCESVDDLENKIKELEITFDADIDFFNYFDNGKVPAFYVSDQTRGELVTFDNGDIVFKSTEEADILVCDKPVMMNYLSHQVEEGSYNQHSVVIDNDSYSLVLAEGGNYREFYQFGIEEEITGDFWEREFRIQFEICSNLPEELRKHGFNDCDAYINDFLDFDRYKFDTELFFNFGSYYIQPLTNESNGANFTFDLFLAFRGDTGDNLHEKMLAYADSVYNVFKASGFNFNGAVDGQVNTEVYFYNAAEGNVNMKVCAITFTTSSEY